MGGFAGFQVRSRTEGLDRDDEAELVQLGTYDPPNDAPPEPSDAELRTAFPRAFRVARLPSGSLSVLMSSYVGRDYSGRWGNFFAHSLVLPQTPRGRWPIDLYEWDGWTTGLAEHEDTEGEPPPLPPVDTAGIPPAESFGFDQLAEFLRDDDTRPAALASMIRALFLRAETSRPVVVHDAPLHNLFWIACLQKCFPPQLLGDVSYSSYQYNPLTCAAVNATAGETDFLFSERERSFQLYLFDRLGGPSSEVPETAGDYAATLARWMTTEPMLVQEFHAFSTLFDLGNGVGTELVHVANLFRAAAHDDVPVSAAEVREALAYLDDRVQPEGYGALIPKLASTLGADAVAADGAVAGRLVALIARGAQQSGVDDHRTLAARSWFTFFDRLVLEGRGNADVVRDARAVVVDALGEHRSVLARVAFQRERVENYMARRDDLEPAVLQTILGELVDAARTLGLEPVWEQKQLWPIINRLATDLSGQPSGLERTLACLGDDSEAIVWTCKGIARFVQQSRRDAGSGEQLRLAGKAIARVLSRGPETLAEQVRVELDAEETVALLVGEWQARLASEADKRALYTEYEQHVLPALPTLNATHAEGFRSDLMNALDDRGKVQQAREWLDRGDIENFSPQLQSLCIPAAASTLSLDPADPHAQEAAAKIRKLLAGRQSQLKPDLPRLREIIDELGAPVGDHPAPLTGASERLRLEDINRALDGITENHYRTFLTHALHLVVRRFGESEGLPATLSALQAGQRRVFTEGYTNHLSKGDSRRLSRDQASALEYWLGMEGKVDPGLEWLQESSLKALETRLKRMDRRDWEDRRDVMDRKLEGDGPSAAAKRWSRIRQRLDAHHKPGFFGGLFGGKKRGR